MNDLGKPANLPGLVQWFQFEERERVRQTIRVLNDLKVSEFRLLFSWADWQRPGGQEWFDFYIHAIGSETRARLIPDLFYTPIEMARPNAFGERKTSHAPQILEHYAKFVDTMIEKYGHYFDWLQIWNEPNWKPYWEWDVDPDGKLFAEMAKLAADVIHAKGKKAALGGLSPYEPQYITQMADLGLMEKIDAVGIHFSPSWDNQRRKWYGWKTEIETARAHLKGLGYQPEVWLAEVGFSSMKRNNAGDFETDTVGILEEQVQFFDGARNAPAEKVLWYSIFDQSPNHLTDDVINMSSSVERVAYHFGMLTHLGEQKPLFRHWKKLVENVL